jgi:hypothetical protein
MDDYIFEPSGRVSQLDFNPKRYWSGAYRSAGASDNVLVVI